MNIKQHPNFEGIFLIDEKIATLNLTPKYKVYDEEVIEIMDREYRIWNPYKSKLGAAIVRGIKLVPIKKGSKVLYLGIAHGTTASHISDIIGEEGIIYGIEISERCFNKLLPVCERRKNIIPLLRDARKPESYSWIEKVDVVYIDIAQPDETEIFIRNCKEFLKKEGYEMIAVKSRSIDVTKSPKEVYKEALKKLEKDFEIIDWKTLDPYERAHCFIIVRIKKNF